VSEAAGSSRKLAPQESEKAVTLQVSDSHVVAQNVGSGSATVNIYSTVPPLDPSVTMRDDVAYALAQLESRNVLYAGMDNEIWKFVFESLHGLRQVLTDTAAKLRTRGPKDVRAALTFMVRLISSYLARHEADYTRYMSEHGGWEPGWAHTERDWLLSTDGCAADDLLQLRRALDQSIANLNTYADTGEALTWTEPWIAQYWADWAHRSAASPAGSPVQDKT
jgi:hypothetical protein